jgi:glycosyltransferase involved in cell wall biosynthesis
MNIPDPAIFKCSSSECRPAPADDALNLVYHGTMAQRLGVGLIIRAAAKVRERIPGVQLHLWGRGDDLNNFYRLVEELGLQGHVHFRPEGFPLEELPRHLRAMNLGVVGNRRSVATDLMLPVKLMEYVALGIPVVAPRLRTIEHYFSEDMVTFYEPENVDSFADAICRLWRTPELRRRQALEASKFIDKFGWDRQGPELVTFYRDLLGIQA